MPITTEIKRAYEQHRRANPNCTLSFEQFAQIAIQNRKAAKSGS